MKDFIVNLGLIVLGLFIVATLILGSSNSVKSAGTTLSNSVTTNITSVDWD